MTTMTPLVFFLVFLLLLFCSITHAQAQQEQEVTYKLYPLVPFSIQIYSSSVLLPSVNDDSLKATIQSVTELYLKQFIDAEILHDEAPMNHNIGTITGVSLQVSIKRPQASTTNNETSSIVALVSSGNAAFEQSSSSSSTNATTTGKDENVVMDGFLKQSLQKAFTLPDVTTFQERLMLTPQEYLQQMTSMIVTLLLDNNDVANDTEDTTTIPYTERTKTTRVTVTTLAVVFVITFCIVVFVRMRRQRHKMVNHHHAATSHHSYTSGGGSHHHYDVRNLACRAHPPPPPPEHHHHDMDPYEQCGTTTPRLMKARISSLVFWNKKNPIHDDDDDSHVATMTNDVYPIHNPRNTTTTTTTTNHHHYYSSYRNNNNEEEEEEDVVDHHIHRSGPFHGGSLASWVKSISSNVFHQSEKDEAECLFEEEDSSGKRIVYRDFPRHDGTPCLIYNSPAVAREQSRKRMMVRSSTSATTSSSRHNVNSSTVWATSNHEENNNNDDEDEEPVDSFVDRLEQLMVVRHEQYEERRHLEMIKRKSSSSRSGRGGNMSLQQAEAALDDFLDISMEDGEEEEVVVPPRVVSPTEQQRQQQQMRTRHVEEESNLRMASHLRAQQHAQVSWDEEDPTITEEERGVFS